MELQLLTSIILSFLLIFLFFGKQKRSSLASNLPPGPWRLPIIGNIHQLVGSLPQQRLQVLAKKYGDIMHLQVGELHQIIISSAEAAKEVMKTHDINFAYRPSFLVGRNIFYNNANIAFSPYGDYWRQLRKICILELLGAKRVQSFRPIREEETSNLVLRISCSQGSQVNLSMLLFSLTYSVISRAAFGTNMGEEREAFTPIAETITRVGGGLNISDLFPSWSLLPVVTGFKSKLERLHQEADKMLDRIINEHRDRKLAAAKTGRKDEADDLVDVLLNLQDDGNLEFPLTTDSIKAVILEMFVAGSETSATAMEWVMSELMKNPEVMEKSQLEVRQLFSSQGKVDEARVDELSYLKLVIKETLRLHPPVPLLLPRECQEECEIKGYRIPSKFNVIINAWAMGKDPSYWVEAETFDPERFQDGAINHKGTNFEYIPFGAGRRMCPGMSFGSANVLLPLASLLFHFDWKLPCEMQPENLDMLEDFGSTLRRKTPLELVPVLRHPLPPHLRSK